MKDVKSANIAEWPDGEIDDNFSFSAVHPDGVFKFLFRYFNDRWNCFVTLPSGEVRAAGVEPNVVSWSGFLDYGLVFITDLPLIDKQSLYSTELVILSWS